MIKCLADDVRKFGGLLLTSLKIGKFGCISETETRRGAGKNWWRRGVDVVAAFS
jgi:hypothetical protein